MTTPFDAVIEQIKARGYHNQRLEDHSDVVSQGILNDLKSRCLPFAQDYETGKITSWKNVRTPGARNRKIDLMVGGAKPDGAPDLERLRLCIENKSVITAHRNLYARFDDLNEALQVLHKAKAEAILVATIIVGVAERVLNIPDRVKPLYKTKPKAFERLVRRLSSGDKLLWSRFESAISLNRPDDAAKPSPNSKSSLPGSLGILIPSDTIMFCWCQLLSITSIRRIYRSRVTLEAWASMWSANTARCSIRSAKRTQLAGISDAQLNWT